MWRSTLEIGAARHSFAPLQKSHRNHHSYEWTQAPYDFRAGAKLSDIAWTNGLGHFTVRRRTKRQNNILCSLQNRRYLGRFGGFRGRHASRNKQFFFSFFSFHMSRALRLRPQISEQTTISVSIVSCFLKRYLSNTPSILINVYT